FCRGGSRPELPVSYPELARHWPTRADPAAVAYWRDRLCDVPPLELPTDRPRPSVRSTRHGDTVAFDIPRALADGLAGLARAHRATLFMVLLAGFQAVLGRHTGQRDFTVGTAYAGRPDEEWEPLIGLFAGTLVLRA